MIEKQSWIFVFSNIRLNVWRTWIIVFQWTIICNPRRLFTPVVSVGSTTSNYEDDDRVCRNRSLIIRTLWKQCGWKKFPHGISDRQICGSQNHPHAWLSSMLIPKCQQTCYRFLLQKSAEMQNRRNRSLAVLHIWKLARATKPCRSQPPPAIVLKIKPDSERSKVTVDRAVITLMYQPVPVL